MKKRNWIIILGIVILLNLFLLITNTGVLINEEKITRGETLNLKTRYFEIQDLDVNDQYHICKYWTGRSVITKNFYVTKVPQCPFTTSFQIKKKK